jgi:hypothetical protein
MGWEGGNGIVQSTSPVADCTCAQTEDTEMVFSFFKKIIPCSQRSVTNMHLYSCSSSEYDWASSQVCCHGQA